MNTLKLTNTSPLVANELPSVIICAPRRDSTLDNLLPSMMIIELDDRLSNHGDVPLIVKPEPTPTLTTTVTKRVTESSQATPAVVDIVPWTPTSPEETLKVDNRIRIAAEGTLSPVRHARSRALSDDEFECCILPRID